MKAHAANERHRLYGKPATGLRLKLYTIIFEADTRAGMAFDVALVIAILLSVATVVLDTVESVNREIGGLLDALEWAFTILFTIEYLARLSCVQHPLRYARSPYGIIDLVSVLPTYLAFFFPGAHALLDIRVLRLLRIFRLFKLTPYMREYEFIASAMRASARKIVVFLLFMMCVALLGATLIYLIEGPEHGFTSIPAAVYFVISVTTSTGLGDTLPRTDWGKALTSVFMILSWSVLAVPTGILSAQIATQRNAARPTTRTCHECLTEGHEPQAKFCRDCGVVLPAYQHS